MSARRAIEVLLLAGAVVCVAVAPAAAQSLRLVAESFDADPAWEGFRNRLLPNPPRTTVEDFGYRTTHHAGGARPGEIGGLVARSVTPAMYVKAIEPRTFHQSLVASGRFSVTRASGGSAVMIGWLNHASRGWRTPNSLAMRINGDGGKYRLFYEYGTTRGMTGGGGAFEGEQWQTTKTPPLVADGTPHRFRLAYDPRGPREQGKLTFWIDDDRYEAEVPLDHKHDDMQLDRFGIWNVQVPGDDMEAYFDDLVVDGARESLDADPKWEGVGNQATFADRVRRPFHDFGFQDSANAGGRAGELGGIIFRDERPAYYGAKVGRLSLDDPLEASGTMTLLRAAADSGTYIGWFDSATKQANETPEHERRQRNFLGLALEGPSRIGHLFRPAYGTGEGAGIVASVDGPWRVIRPDAQVHHWRLRYDPTAAAGNGRIELTVDGDTQHLELARGHKLLGATFDRFGIFNMQAGGHFVDVYFDDLKYTNR